MAEGLLFDADLVGSDVPVLSVESCTAECQHVIEIRRTQNTFSKIVINVSVSLIALSNALVTFLMVFDSRPFTRLFVSF